MSERKGGGGRKDVRAGIADAKVVELRPKADARTTTAPDDVEDRRFLYRDDGIYRRKGDGPPGFICGLVHVLAESRDETGHNWGLLLSWKDRDGVHHEEAFPRALFSGDGNEIRSRLSDGGLTLGSGTAARGAFLEWLCSLKSDKRARSVTRVGWHSFGASSAFVLPDETIGEADERIVLQTGDREPSLFGVAGTAEDWREKIGSVCRGNSRLTFAASCAFAAPLLGLLGEEGGGISFKGDSRVGKSTALRVAASVCGAGSYVRSWRSTSNGIESTALASCDVLLPLDEMGQLDPREAGDIAYLLANGQGKTRSTRTGGARAVARWRVLFLATGEVGLADLNREAGKATKAGQEVRFCDLPADAGRGMGLFEALHHEDTPDAFARYLRSITGEVYGAPLRAFLGRLLQTLRAEGEDELRTRLRARIGAISDAWLRDHPSASGQVRSVAARFAMVALGGELATGYGLTGWDDDASVEMARICFQAWLADRGTVGRREEEQAVQQLRDFIAKHGDARFERWIDVSASDAHQGGEADTPPGERFRTQNRAGWKRWMKEADGRNGWRYYLLSDAMNEALHGLNGRSAKQVLVDRGFLLAGGDKNSVSVSPPGHKKVRAYEVTGAILGADEGDR